MLAIDLPTRLTWLAIRNDILERVGADLDPEQEKRVLAEARLFLTEALLTDVEWHLATNRLYVRVAHVTEDDAVRRATRAVEALIEQLADLVPDILGLDYYA